MAARSILFDKPRPRASLSTKKHTMDHTGRSSTGFMTEDRRSLA
jgi:hypothetical protein